MSHGCQLYRHFDTAGALLYVGIAVCSIRRTREHIKRSDWYDEIARIEIEKFPTRIDAMAAEEIAILKEKPKFNRQKTHRISTARRSLNVATSARSKFDRTAYQREYMRKRRQAEQRAKAKQ